MDLEREEGGLTGLRVQTSKTVPPPLRLHGSPSLQIQIQIQIQITSLPATPG